VCMMVDADLERLQTSIRRGELEPVH
jgi:hypothetical protein